MRMSSMPTCAGSLWELETCTAECFTSGKHTLFQEHPSSQRTEVIVATKNDPGKASCHGSAKEYLERCIGDEGSIRTACMRHQPLPSGGIMWTEPRINWAASTSYCAVPFPHCQETASPKVLRADIGGGMGSLKPEGGQGSSGC